MEMKSTAQEPARYVRVSCVRKAGREPVYNMEVEGTHNYAINGGVIVHNCEALRYGLMSRPSSFREKIEQKKNILTFDPYSTPKERKSGFLSL